jgi:hypothetical protein
MKLNENNLLGAVTELRAKGYEDDYIVDRNNLICTNSNKYLDHLRIMNVRVENIKE